MRLSSANSNCRVILVAAVPPPIHGNTVWAQDVINYFTRNRSIDLTHYDLSDHRSITNIGRFDFYNIWLALKQVLLFPFFLLKRKPDIVHIPLAMNYAGFLRDGLLIIAARIFCSCQIIVHLHGGRFLDFHTSANRLFRSFINKTMKLVDLPVVLGESLSHQVAPWFAFEDVAVIHNGVSRELMENSCHNHVNGRCLKIGFLGNLLQTKGVKEFIVVVSKLIQKGIMVQAELVGNWYDEAFHKDIQSFIETNDIQLSVKCYGGLYGDDKISVMKNWDIFFYPSHTEGMPLVVLEAMALRIPVVVTDVGAIRDMIDDGLDGFIVKLGDLDGMQDRLETLCSDACLRNQMSTKAQEKVRTCFVLENNLNKLGSLWCRLTKVDWHD